MMNKKENNLVGLTEAEAGAKLKEQGSSYRISSRDGEYYIVTMDLRMDRYNLHIENGKVISFEMG